MFFFFNDTATTEIYTLSLHDALPISTCRSRPAAAGSVFLLKYLETALVGRTTTCFRSDKRVMSVSVMPNCVITRSEEHTSELQSQSNLVCRLLLEKKKKN